MSKIKYLASSVMGAAFMISAAQSEVMANGPYVTVNYPESVKLYGGQTSRTVNCASLHRITGEKKLRITCDFAEQVDSNGQNICDDTNNMSGNIKRQKNTLSIALWKSLTHMGRQHGDCKFQAAVFDSKLGKSASDLNKIYGQSWRSEKSCRLLDAKNECKNLMGLD